MPFFSLEREFFTARRLDRLLAALASGRLNLDGLITHRIDAADVGSACDGLLKKKDEYLGVVLRRTGS